MRFIGRLKAAIPPPVSTITHSVLWGLLIGVSVTLSLYFLGWRTPALIAPIVLICGLGSALSWPFARYFVRLISPDARTTRRIAADLALHPAASIFTAGLIYAFVFRTYFAQWHGDFLSTLWIYSFIFTIAGAIYSFLVLAVPMMMPGFAVALCGYILWMTLKRR